MENKYIIGIDLGTTNCTLSYALANEDEAEIKLFPLTQYVKKDLKAQNCLLPSFLYFPLDNELSDELVIGSYAKLRGSEVPTRLVSSTKSWLCHSGIDRREPFLPLEADENIQKISPLQGTYHLLQFLKNAWNESFSEIFNEQQVLITVPASFDPQARQLVLEAAKMADYPEITLLEEPQAAFYAWLNEKKEDWRKKVKVGDSIVVIDIGGGTTDFSLIQVEDEDGNLTLNRKAVGNHLLLGGDNIDYALAYFAKNKLEENGHTISEWQTQSLVHHCRLAKEQFFGDNPPQTIDITIQGRGSRLIGNSLKVTLELDEIEKIILDGFFPNIKPWERSKVEKRLGLQHLGLPFAQDPRITSQLAKFLSMTGESDSETMDLFEMPSAILFNGGTLKATAFQERLVEVMNGWAEQLHKKPIQVLDGLDLDFAVSRGAVCYGLARQGKAIRIKSGTSRSYYLGIEEARPAIPGLATPLRAICIVPFGCEEGSELELSSHDFVLVIGDTALFRFFSHSTKKLSNGEEPVVGTVVKNWAKELTEHHPLEVALNRGENDGKTVRVKIKSKVSELGFIEIYCISNDEREWKLEFDIRKVEAVAKN
ncbi:Heat shock protein 70 [Candidatus Rubidus massiliensis]|nr:Heat shock protein 70 [Candidatus Rubidus massiliensis]